METDELSLRDEIEAAATVEEETPPEVETPEVEAQPEEIEAKPERERDEKGRFVAKTDETPAEPEVQTETPKEQEPAPEPDTIAAPVNWSPAGQAHWANVPPEVQQYIADRETDLHKTLTRHDDERDFGRSMYKEVQPYLAQIQAEGGTPQTAIRDLLNTAYILRTGDPETKRQLIIQTAHQFGVDLTNTELPQMTPEVQPLYNRIQSLEDTIRSQGQQQEQQLREQIDKEITAFSQDPKNVHYEAVKAHMGQLIGSGAYSTLEEAYDAACWSNPEIRDSILAQQRLEEDEKQKAEQRKRTEDSKRKDVSVTGDRGATVSNGSGNKTLRDEIASNMSASTTGV